MDKRFVCPCGLTCCDCLFYKNEIYETANKLKELIMENGLDKFLLGCSNEKSWGAMGEHLDLNDNETHDILGKRFGIFKQIPEFMSVLDGITTLQCKTTCQEARGCSVGGDTHKCKALKCLENNGYEGCWQCSEYEICGKLGFLKNGYGYVIEENLTIVKEEGFGAVKSRGNKYYAWQRK